MILHSRTCTFWMNSTDSLFRLFWFSVLICCQQSYGKPFFLSKVWNPLLKYLFDVYITICQRWRSNCNSFIFKGESETWRNFETFLLIKKSILVPSTKLWLALKKGYGKNLWIHSSYSTHFFFSPLSQFMSLGTKTIK